MPRVTLTVTVPKSVWIGRFSRQYPGTQFEVLAATLGGSTGVVEVELVGPDPGGVCEEIRGCEDVVSVTAFDCDGGRCRIQVETAVPSPLSSVGMSDAPVAMPFEIADGEMRLETTVPERQVSKFGERLDDAGVAFSVERVEYGGRSGGLLTDRQRWVLDRAIDNGYYDTPRGITQTELAEELGIAPSTCSGVLHRAEERVLKKYIKREQGRRDPAVASSD